MSELLSTEAWETAMKAGGYNSPLRTSHSMLFEAEGKRSYRVSPYPPNPATKGWMERNNVKDARCLPHEDYVPQIDPLPEFGLEAGDPYHDDVETVSKSQLAVFMESPREFYEMFVTGLMPRKKMSPFMKFGSICHAMLLEKRRLDETCVAYPYSCYTAGANPRLKTKEAQAFDRQVAPLLAVRPQMLPIIESVIANAKASEFGSLLTVNSSRAKFEHRLDAVIEGVACRCKPDIHIVMDDHIIVPDLKFGAFKPDDWKRSSTRFCYWLQQAHYTAILKAVYNLPVFWKFWAFESTYPYRVGPKWYDERSVEIAAETHKNLLRELKKCRETGVWADHYSGETQLAPWDITVRGEKESQEESTDENPVSYDDDQDYEAVQVDF